MHRLPAVDADRGALVVQLAGVTEAAREVEQLGSGLLVVIAREAEARCRIPVRIGLLVEIRANP